VYNLFGLDLIGQDEGSQTRTLLAGGLGSVRMEMVEDEVESVTTYGPYGNLLAQTGNDEPVAGTDYGYTGEQHDASTGLLYLRARYYNPSLRSFMGRDPWSGNQQQPQSMNGWSYVGNSPINWVDPTGMIPKQFPDHCRKASSYPSYGDCVRAEYGVMYYHGDHEDFVREYLNNVAPTSDETGCYEGPVPYRARGYIEGLSADVGVAVSFGLEMVYDFATMEKQNFGYVATPSLNASSLYGGVFKGRFPIADWFNYSFSASVGYLSGFRNWTGEGVGGIINDYSGYFRVVSVGASSLPGLPYSGSINHFSGDPDTTIRGIGFSFGFSANVWDLLGIPNPVNWRLDASISYAYYKALGTTDHYYTEDENGRRWVQPARVSGDILLGLRSPLTYAMGAAGILAYTGIGTVPALTFIGAGVAARGIGAYQAYQDAQIYNGIHRDSYSQ
jgi:RHS repeat-associated protein